jgi:hypothetical protein
MLPDSRWKLILPLDLETKLKFSQRPVKSLQKTTALVALFVFMAEKLHFINFRLNTISARLRKRDLQHYSLTSLMPPMFSFWQLWLCDPWKGLSMELLLLKLRNTDKELDDCLSEKRKPLSVLWTATGAYGPRKTALLKRRGEFYYFGFFCVCAWKYTHVNEVCVCKSQAWVF